MSTKIYNGYALDITPNLLELRKFCTELRLRLEHERYLQLRRIYSNSGREGLHTAFEAMQAVKRTGLRDPIFDFTFELTVFPVFTNELFERLLCMTFEDNRGLRRVWEDIPEVSYYGYWNNTDQPENISDIEWEKRLS